jgi:hypothetical protein
VLGASHVAPLVIGIVRLVVRRARVGVEHVVEIDRHVRPRPAESQVLAEANVERVERVGKRVPLRRRLTVCCARDPASAGRPVCASRIALETL